jgi:hypothetical protein
MIFGKDTYSRRRHWWDAGGLSTAPAASSRTARELRDVFVEGLGRKLQSFDRGEIWKNRISEVVNRQPLPNGERGRLDGVRSLRRQKEYARRADAAIWHQPPA